MALRGRSAIITGANQGLGLAIARRFIEAGANVLLAARGVERLQQAEAELKSHARLGQIIISQTADVSRPESCQALVRRAREALPNLTILVNNAGVYGPIARVEDNNWDEWVQALQINLFGTVLMCRAMLPHLREQRYGKIINLSGGGATAPLPRFSCYAASKAAVVRFTETLAEEVREDRIDVNAIAPGALNTRLLDQVLAAGPDKVGQAFYERSCRQREEGGAPLEKGAALAVFLASDASDGITGRLLSAVWDNWAELPARQEHLAKSDIYTLRRIVPEDRGQKWQCA
ncbi:MAG TPA: SDR family oxidoreductase [Gemmataceae bacterium]|nr:SDR family oxidoreductase [Gemmataceae bacterium]